MAGYVPVPGTHDFSNQVTVIVSGKEPLLIRLCILAIGPKEVASSQKA